MEQLQFAGPLIRQLRLERNWSQETLCKGICAVSYLSKIEQGKVEPNENMIRDLLARLDVNWQTDKTRCREMTRLCGEQMDKLFALEKLDEAVIISAWNARCFGSWYLDLMILYAYCNEAFLIPREMEPLLNGQQRCLMALLKEQPGLAHQFYPCPLTMFHIGRQSYEKGKYTLALEYLQHAYDAACGNGLVQIMLMSQIYMSNSYSDQQNQQAMERHLIVARRLARYLRNEEVLGDLEYNTASTCMELGDYEAAYRYFSTVKEPSVLHLHKLAICCEHFGLYQEALDAITSAEVMLPAESVVKRSMCAVVRYRLEHPDYLHDETYGTLLMQTFQLLREKMPQGFARFHLPWVRAWLTANRQYRQAYELMLDFTNCHC